MIEVTVIEPSEHDEIMVNIDSSTKKVIQVYCYSKYVPSIYNESKDTEREVRTYEMKNSLLLTLPARINRIIIPICIDSSVIFCSLRYCCKNANLITRHFLLALVK